MFKRVLAAGFALLLVSVLLTPVSAQTGLIGAYWDPFFTKEDAPFPCAGINAPVSIYIAALNWNTFITGAQYSVTLPASLAYLADVSPASVTLGTSPGGIAHGFNLPQNGFFPVLLNEIKAVWLCNTCTGNENGKVIVGPHPHLGPVGITDWPQFNFLPGIGLTALVCATIPTEETTWGKVKSLYSE